MWWVKLDEPSSAKQKAPLLDEFPRLATQHPGADDQHSIADLELHPVSVARLLPTLRKLATGTARDRRFLRARRSGARAGIWRALGPPVILSHASILFSTARIAVGLRRRRA